jgi:hypothetical protein
VEPLGLGAFLEGHMDRPRATYFVVPFMRAAPSGDPLVSGDFMVPTRGVLSTSVRRQEPSSCFYHNTRRR